jgi:hypothetical protein
VSFSCTRQDEGLKRIEVNSRSASSLKLSEIAEDVKLVALETNKSCLLGGIKNVQLFDDELFVLDYSEPKIVRFDLQGRFINRIGSKGRGPGEYPGIIAFSIDEKSSILLLSNHSNIMFFDLDGNYLGKIPHNNTYIEEIAFVNNEIFLIGNKFGLKANNGHFFTRTILYKLDEEVIYDSLIVQDTPSKPNEAASHPGAFYLSDINEGLFIYTPVLLYENILRDTLFRIKDSEIEPIFRFKFVAESKLDEPRGAITILNIYRSSRYFFVEYTSLRTDYFFIYDQFSNESWITEAGIDDDIYNSGKIKLRPLIEKKGLFYFIMSASSVSNVMDGVYEDDNSVIAIVKVKGVEGEE